jgi:hypothetical protein
LLALGSVGVGSSDSLGNRESGNSNSRVKSATSTLVIDFGRNLNVLNFVSIVRRSFDTDGAMTPSFSSASITPRYA